MYWQAITVIEAQNILIDFSVADFPHQKKHTRSRVHKSIYKKAYPFTEVEVTTEGLANILKGRVNG